MNEYSRVAIEYNQRVKQMQEDLDALLEERSAKLKELSAKSTQTYQVMARSEEES